MSETIPIEAQGPGVLIIRLVSLLMTMRGKIQTLEKDSQQRTRQSDSEVRSKSATFLAGVQVQEAGETQKENFAGKDMQMRQNVIPIFSTAEAWTALIEKNSTHCLLYFTYLI